MLGSGKIIMVRRGDSIEVRAYEETDLTSYFDSVEVEVESDLSDWHAVRSELRARRTR